MKELTERQLLQLEAPETLILFIYTPFCGTCAAARRMLNILEQMRPDVLLYEANINFLPQLTRRWEITSVPCLLLLKRGQPADRLYAMKSIDHVYRFLFPEADGFTKA